MQVVMANLTERWVLTSDDRVLPISWFADSDGDVTSDLDEAFLFVCEFPFGGRWWFWVSEIVARTVH